jgi:hypothetical protein
MVSAPPQAAPALADAPPAKPIAGPVVSQPAPTLSPQSPTVVSTSFEHPTQRLQGTALSLNNRVAVDTAAHALTDPAQPPTVSTSAQNSVDVQTATPGIPAAHPQTQAGKDDSGGWSSEQVALVSNDKLDTMRGGFEMPSGLIVSFGITREAFVNGTLVSSAAVNIPDIAHMTAQQAQMLVAVNAAGLIQNGAGNVVQGTLPQLGGTTIQNTLSNQQIQALTTISTTVNSLAMFQGLNIANTLNSALTSAIHPR